MFKQLLLCDFFYVSEEYFNVAMFHWMLQNISCECFRIHVSILQCFHGMLQNVLCGCFKIRSHVARNMRSLLRATWFDDVYGR